MDSDLQPVRMPAVAGTFYPASPAKLDALIRGLLAEVPVDEGAPPKALIVPHAGLVYSGPIAATAYATLRPFAKRITRIVLVGPAHRAYVDGLASPGAQALRTPLGDVAVDLAALEDVPEVPVDAMAHAAEHSLEVQLPFLQELLPHAKLVPFVVGKASSEDVGRVLEALWGGPETLIVISSDLSHYLPYAEGHATDRRTAERIVALASDIDPEEACGCAGVNGLLWVARRKGLRGRVLDLRSSGDTAGPRSEVVGYGAFAFSEEAPA
jgi:AmmeMemoRadiSam system protein B